MEIAKVESLKSGDLKLNWDAIKKFMLYMFHPAPLSMNFWTSQLWFLICYYYKLFIIIYLVYWYILRHNSTKDTRITNQQLKKLKLRNFKKAIGRRYKHREKIQSFSTVLLFLLITFTSRIHVCWSQC